MSRILLVLLLFPAICFSALQRPWANETWVSENPNIWSFGGELWWNVPEFQSSIETFGTNGEYSTTDVAAELAAARASVESARSFHDLCILRMLGSLGGLPFSPGLSFMGLFSRISECTFYREKWKSSADHILASVELSLSHAENSLARAKTAYYGLVFSGLCESEYSGPGSENCGEFRNAFLSVENNITEGNYGKYSLALQKNTELNSALSAPSPDFSPAVAILDLVWTDGGVVDSFEAISAKADSAQKNASMEFQAAYRAANAKKSAASSKIAELEDQNYELIDRAASGLKVGSISKRFLDLRASFSAGSLTLSESKNLFDSIGRKNYLSSSVSKAVSSDEKLAVILEKLAGLENDAAAAVSDQERETIEELRQASEYAKESGGTSSLSYVQRAEKLLSEARAANSLGTKFVRLSESAALARSARSTSAEEDVSRSSNLSAIADLLERAEKDGLNVVQEKQAAQMIGKLPPSVSSEKMRELSSLIISKARSAFDTDLSFRRARILEKISLAGNDASDLKSELERIEKNLVSDGKIIFPDAIGSLKALDSGYAYLDKELEAYMSEIVGNSMSASASPVILQAALDSPSEIALDLALSNAKRYSSRNVEVLISLDRPIPFLLSEIVSGRDDVESVRMSDGNRILSIIFSDVEPFETKRVIFSKKQTIARKISDETEATGLGDGSAFVRRVIEFELDTLVGTLSFPSGVSNPVIDGESKKAPLHAGRHRMESERIVPGAYTLAIQNINAYAIGTNSRVEFDMVLDPKIELRSASIFFDSINDSAISSFDIQSPSGHMIKNKRRISETRVAADIGELRKAMPATIRASYLVENTGEFVERQIGILGSLNLSGRASAIMAAARQQALSGNYTDALELVEKAKAVQREDETKVNENRDRFETHSREIQTEISLLDSIISSSLLNDSFIQKLSARKGELERVLAESNESNFNAMEKFDSKWLEKETAALKKDLYKRYNDLKERFFDAGNSSTPPEFLQFEESFLRFDSGGGPELSPAALAAIYEAEKIVELQEAFFHSRKESLRNSFDGAKMDLLASWDKYSRQASAARGTDFSGMFSETERNVNALIKAAESSIDSDPRTFIDRLEEINRTRSKLDSTLDLLRSQAASRISLLEETPGAAEEIGQARVLIDQGEYVNALRMLSSVAKDSREPEQDDSSLPIIGITALAILGAAGVYMMKPKKELRKLNSWKVPNSNGPEKFSPEK